MPIWLNDFGYWLASLVCMCNKHVCYTRVFMCVLRPEVDTGCLPQSLSALFCEMQGLTEAGAHEFWLDSPRIRLSLPPRHQTDRSTLPTLALYVTCWGWELRTLLMIYPPSPLVF